MTCKSSPMAQLLFVCLTVSLLSFASIPRMPQLQRFESSVARVQGHRSRSEETLHMIIPVTRQYVGAYVCFIFRVVSSLIKSSPSITSLTDRATLKTERESHLLLEVQEGRDADVHDRDRHEHERQVRAKLAHAFKLGPRCDLERTRQKVDHHLQSELECERHKLR